ncbi:MFS transporter [Paraoerskovia marina]|uniref:MFS transporter n=1 Tax=Paraoerskovia marina TaxID=545619 RepID=UPI0004924429|nr:MFS transporter [Paraoerskovia marina]
MTEPRRAYHRPGDVRAAFAGLVALSLSTFVAITTELLPVGLLPQIASGVSVSESTAGLLVSVYALLVAALAFPLTAWTRSLPRKPLIVATLVGYAASNVIVAVAPNFAMIAAGRALGGIAHALFFSVAIGYASRLVRPEFTGRALTIATLGGSAGFVVGVPLTTSLGTALGWRAAFWVLALLCALMALVVVWLLPPVEMLAASPDDAPRPTGSVGALATVGAVNTLAFLGHYAVYTFISVMLLGAGLAESSVGPVLLAFGAVGLLGVWFAGTFVDRRPRWATLMALGTVAVGLLGAGLAYPHLWPLLAVGLVWLAAFGSLPAIIQAAAIRAHQGSPDTAGALVNSTANAGIGLGAALGGGVLAVSGIAVLPFVGAAIVLVAVLVVVFARRAFPADPPRS